MKTATSIILETEEIEDIIKGVKTLSPKGQKIKELETLIVKLEKYKNEKIVSCDCHCSEYCENYYKD